MFIILIVFLILISIACFFEANTERKEIKITLSIALAVMVSFMMEASAHSLVASGTLGGMPLMICYYALPIFTFSLFQLLLYEIRLFSKD